MSTYFTIGEMAKMHNISVQTLRHYDKIGLIKPDYINESSGYRYYSMRHFSTIDLIKECKTMGLSLEEIKIIIGNYSSLESICDILNKQKSIIDNKIKELSNIRKAVSILENKINEAFKYGLNNVFIKHNDERKFIKYNYSGRYTQEFEINLRKVLLDVEKNYSSYASEITFTTSYEDVKNDSEFTYSYMMMHVPMDTECTNKEIIILPRGNYVTLYFDGDYRDTKSYYAKLMEYIKKNKINVKGAFHEIYIMTRVGVEGKEQSLAQIEILMEE